MHIKLMLLGLAIAFAATNAVAQPFTYQGFLRDAGSPATGAYNMTFRLYPVNAGGAALATVLRTASSPKTSISASFGPEPTAI